MKTNHIYLTLLLAMISLVAYAQPKGYKKTKDGLFYKVHRDNTKTRVAASGDVLKLNFIIKTEKDSIIRNTFAEGTPIEMALKPGLFKGSLEDGLTLVSAGDSISFLVNADSLFAKVYQSELPPFLRKGSYLGFTISMISVMTMDEYKKDAEKRATEALAKEDQTIQDFIKKNNLQATKTASGLYYVQKKVGTGVKAENGKTVAVHYTGKLLNGTKFDSSVDRGQPIEFPLGMGRVIRGWDEGIANMYVGEQGMLLIPSGLGYGPQGSPPVIPPNSVLVFDVELMEVK